MRNTTVFGRFGWQTVRYFNLSLARCDSGHAESRYSPSSVDSSDTRRRSIGQMAQGAGAACHFARGRHAGAGMRTVAARIAPRPSPVPIAPEAEVGPRRRNGAVQFVISGLRTNGFPKTGKSMRYNSRVGVRQPMPFRKHQVDCLRLWRLSSPWILKRILLAIFNIRAGAKRARDLSRGPQRKDFECEQGAEMAGASMRTCFVKSN